MTILDSYQEIFLEGKWSYYPCQYFGNFPFLSEICADEFIINYFKRGGKEKVFDKSFKGGNKRNMHSISTFFLGKLIEPLIFVKSNNTTEINNTNEPDFNYFWFLSCLYHDYGYFVEHNKTKYPPKKYDLKGICKLLNIENDLLKAEYQHHFDTETIINYYDYCRNELNFINHGIIGGLLLYDRLLKNYESTKEKANDGVNGASEEDFIYNNLHWSRNHETFYAKAADNIISHNIWVSPINNKEKSRIYHENHLDKLIIQKDQRLNCSDSLLSLVSICDTIEPLKSFSQFIPDCILNKLYITTSTSDRNINITIFDNCINLEPYFENIKYLEEWLNVEVSVNETKTSITIKIIDKKNDLH